MCAGAMQSIPPPPAPRPRGARGYVRSSQFREFFFFLLDWPLTCMIQCRLPRDTSYPGRLIPQKEKEARDPPDSFSAVGSGGRDCFSARGSRRLKARAEARRRPGRETRNVSPRTAENPDEPSGAPVYRHRWKTACHTSASLSSLDPVRAPARGVRAVPRSVPGNRPEC